jgi:hypothetical protein
MTTRPFAESRLPVGSSASSTAGRPATTRGTATRFGYSINLLMAQPVLNPRYLIDRDQLRRYGVKLRLAGKSADLQRWMSEVGVELS